MSIIYSHASLSDHLEVVNSKRKMKPDNRAFNKVIHDVVVKIKYDSKHLKKKRNFYYVSNIEQAKIIEKKLKEYNIFVDYKKEDDYVKIFIKKGENKDER